MPHSLQGFSLQYYTSVMIIPKPKIYIWWRWFIKRILSWWWSSSFWYSFREREREIIDLKFCNWCASKQCTIDMVIYLLVCRMILSSNAFRILGEKKTRILPDVSIIWFFRSSFQNFELARPRIENRKNPNGAMIIIKSIISGNKPSLHLSTIIGATVSWD